MAIICHFREFLQFYSILDYYKMITKRNFSNPNGKSLDLRLIIRVTLKELFSGSTDFTEANLKIPQISKHFSAMLAAN